MAYAVELGEFGRRMTEMRTRSSTGKTGDIPIYRAANSRSSSTSKPPEAHEFYPIARIAARIDEVLD
jgi:hypothetical protein